MTLIAYTNADWASTVDDRKSTSGASFYLGDCLVSWMSKKQSLVTLFIGEVEYIVAVAYYT